METIYNVLIGLGFALFVVIIILLAVAIALYIEVRILINRKNKVKQELTKQEARLLEVATFIGNLTSLTGSYISELMRKRQELQDKKCNCKQTQTDTELSAKLP